MGSLRARARPWLLRPLRTVTNAPIEGMKFVASLRPSRSASPRSRAKSCQRAKGLRGTDRPRPLRKLGSLSAPRLCGDIEAPATAYRSKPARDLSPESRRPGAKPGVWRRTPEVGPLPCRRGSGLAICLGPLVSAGTSGAAPLIPRHRRSAARVLMDEGWGECKAASRGGDKFGA